MPESYYATADSYLTFSPYNVIEIREIRGRHAVGFLQKLYQHPWQNVIKIKLHFIQASEATMLLQNEPFFSINRLQKPLVKTNFQKTWHDDREIVSMITTWYFPKILQDLMVRPCILYYPDIRHLFQKDHLVWIPPYALFWTTKCKQWWVVCKTNIPN